MPVFLQGRRAFFIIPTPPTSPLQPLISPPRHRFGPCLPAPRLCVPRLPRCGCRLPLLLSPRLPRCGCRLPLLSSPRLPRCGCLRTPKRHTARAPSAVLRDVAQPIPVPVLPGTQKRRTEPHRGPSAAKKQPICRGSITAAALQPVRSVHAPETNPFRIVRAGISG